MRTREEQKIMQIRRRIKWKRSKRDFTVFALAVMILVVAVYHMSR
jgi:hypothetical protein